MILDLLHRHGFRVNLHPRYPYASISTGGQYWLVKVEGDRISSATPWLQQWIESVAATASCGNEEANND